MASGTTVAVIPARGGSKRLPRKNVLDLGGRPVIHYPITTALASRLFRRVIVSTEDHEIAAIAQAEGAEVLARPFEHATDTATVVDVCLHTLQVLAAEGLKPSAFCCIYATAAFLDPIDLTASLALLNEHPQADVVMGVSGYPIHPFKALRSVDGYLVPEFPDQVAAKSQNYPHLVASNGTFYWGRSGSFVANRTFYPRRLKGYALPSDRAVDLDTPEDLEWARRLQRLRAADVSLPNGSDGSGV